MQPIMRYNMPPETIAIDNRAKPDIRQMVVIDVVIREKAQGEQGTVD